MAVNNPIQALLQLDGTSPQFPDQLSDILARRGFDESIESLETNSLVPIAIVEYLDDVLPGFRQFLSLSTESVIGLG